MVHAIIAEAGLKSFQQIRQLLVRPTTQTSINFAAVLQLEATPFLTGSDHLSYLRFPVWSCSMSQLCKARGGFSFHLFRRCTTT